MIRPDLLLLALLAVQSAWSVLLLHLHTRERTAWTVERNALIERLVPGSTPQPEAPPQFRPIIGDDRREWLASLDPETRAQVELEVRNGRVE